MAVLRGIGILLIILALAAAAFVAYAWRTEIPPIEAADAKNPDPTMVERGRTLAAIGNCATCHTSTGGEAFAGGRPFKTPFGTIYASNITPDPETGIGRWSEAAFQRSMREGVNREGEHLYPAFPYDHFTLVTDDDNRALYAFLMSRRPMKAKVPQSNLVFPLNIRMTVAAWKLLYFKPGPYQSDAVQGAGWNRGAYLAEGLGHCGACHTPRDLLQAEKRDTHFNGGEVEGWHAYAINGRSTAPIPWTADALAFYLRNGWHQAHGMARGPMAPVVEDLATVPEADVRAIASYVGDMMPPQQPLLTQGLAEGAGANAAPRAERLASGDSLVSLPSPAPSADGAGAQIYAAACATCHESGRPLPFGGINLRLSTAIHGESPRNLINVTLYGLPARPGERSPMMPGFRASLTNAQIETLAAYLRSHLSGKPAWPDLARTIREARDGATAPSLYMSPGAQTAPDDPREEGVAW